MKRSVRVAILAAAVSAALAFAGSALAQFAPRLIVDQDVYRPGGSAGTTSIEVVGKKEENAIAKLTIYVPPSYTANISQAPWTTIGSVIASVQAKQIGENAILPITGSVVVADQNNSTLQMQSIACTGVARHATVWLLQLTAAGQQLTVPLFVDRAAAPESAFASYKIQLCLPSP